MKLLKLALPAALSALLLLALAGCPSTSQRTQIAQAALTASSGVGAFQQGEIVAHQQGIVSDADHQFIQRELISVALMGKTLDTCIKTTTNTQGDLACINTAVTAVDQINSDGGLNIKNVQTKQTFQVTMVGVKAALTAITQILGGK